MIFSPYFYVYRLYSIDKFHIKMTVRVSIILLALTNICRKLLGDFLMEKREFLVDINKIVTDFMQYLQRKKRHRKTFTNLRKLY